MRVWSTLCFLIIAISTIIIIVKSRPQLQANANNRIDEFHKLIVMVAVVSCICELLSIIHFSSENPSDEYFNHKFHQTYIFFLILNSTMNFPIYCTKHRLFRHFCRDIRKWLMKVTHVGEGASKYAPVFNLSANSLTH